VVICDKDNLKITDSLMEQIQAEPDIPKSIYLRLADLCLNNQLYQHACKCFALGGDRLKAMSALLKSGDKDKIITFASNIFIKIDVSRHPDIYTIAANYLQTLNWMNDGIIMRTVIQFYTKAKAYSSLSRFYETCSQIEVDEFQNYEKALAALSEAEKVLSKDPNASVESLKYKQKVISLFLDAHHYAQERNVEQCESICAELLNQNDIDVNLFDNRQSSELEIFLDY
jgi:intraflagellar transport protein 140